MTELLTPSELAETLKVPKSWVYLKTRDKTGIPRLMVGRHLRFHLSDVIKWLKTQNKTNIQ